ncbi:hypothetical protein ABNQ39_22775 [Azospirillum sp. A26]|uniref:hypothetical protein n=1 Tax=Azospirillum sp. A26 TaxID=3160607 RepID=UPI00367067F7
MASRMARIVHMGKLGGFAALLDGRMLELEGCFLWPSATALSDAARRAGIALSDLILDTRSTTGPAGPAATVSAQSAARFRSGGLPLAA